jgi:hypothetical protein
MQHSRISPLGERDELEATESGREKSGFAPRPPLETSDFEPIAPTFGQTKRFAAAVAALPEGRAELAFIVDALGMAAHTSRRRKVTGAVRFILAQLRYLVSLTDQQATEADPEQHLAMQAAMEALSAAPDSAITHAWLFFSLHDAAEPYLERSSTG